MSSYLVQRGDQRYGPYTPQELQQYVAEGRVLLTDLAWAEGMPAWVTVADVIGSSVPSPGIKPPLPEPYVPGKIAPAASKKPQSYLVHAILATLFCCLPFGVVAIIYAAQVDSKYASGDLAGAERASMSAKKWYYAAVVTGGIFMILWLAAAVASRR